MVDYLITLTTTLLRLHQSTNIKQDLASLQKYYLPRMKTSLGQLSLKYIGPKIWSNIPEKLKSSSPYSFGKQHKKVLLSCQTSCWSSFYNLSHSVKLRWCHCFPSYLPLWLLTPPTIHRHAFTHCFCCCFYAYFTWRWFGAFCYFYYYL